MGNTNTEHSKNLRAKSAAASNRKRRANPNNASLTIEGDIKVIQGFIALLEATGENKRITQLAAIVQKLTSK